MAIYFIRHWQTKNNLENRMNTGDDNDPLTEVWKDQAREAWKNFSQDISFDVIITSHLSRAKETARLFAKEIWYTWNIYQDTRLREQDGWIFKWKKRDDIKQEYNISDDYDFRKLFKNKEYNKKEDITEFDARVWEFLCDLGENFPNKNILLVAHSGTSRALLRNVQNLDFEEIHFNMPGVKNCEIINLDNYWR